MTLEGYVEHIKYHNEENGYTVAELATKEELVICCGYMTGLQEGESIRVEGSFSFHPTYGPQFKVTSYQMNGIRDLYAVERYLASGAIKGIGAALAARITARFGEDTWRILEEEPERLAEIKGISENKARDIAIQLEEQTTIRQAMFFLQQYGISIKTGTKLYQYYKDDIYDLIRNNPYQMTMDIEGIGFVTADEIAQKAGIARNFPYRIKSGLKYVLQQALNEGHTYLPEDVFFRRGALLLGLLEEELTDGVNDLLFEGEIVTKKNHRGIKVYLRKVFLMEKETTQKLFALAGPIPFDRKACLDVIERYMEQEALALDQMQSEAVLMAAGQGISLITGGPGTGKTTIIRLLIRYFGRQGLDVMLAAPTGRAARRMTEAAGYEAKTIHRMLELGTLDDEDRTNAYFGRNEEYPLETDVIIIDEVSMVDIYLMNSLLKAVLPGTRLILVGDMHQLPSVGPGTILKDLVYSQAFPVMELTHIFRQAARSDIVLNAHKIKEGVHVRTDNQSRDFFFLERNHPQVIAEAVKYLVTRKLPPYVEAQPFDIQVITPMRKGYLGVEELNKILQETLNPPGEGKREKSVAGGVFREGDKVMQIKNNYQTEWEVRNDRDIVTDQGHGVFNGDIGQIKRIDPVMETVTVVFDEIKEVRYEYSQLEELELAYAITVHKSQGSEYPAVVIPLLGVPKILMTRNLLYTAVTRAKRAVTIVGNGEILFRMIDNPSELKRYSGLIDCIQEVKELEERKPID